MPGQEIDVHHRAVGEIVDAVQTGDRGRRGAAAHIDEDPIGAQDRRADLHLARRHEARMPLVDAAIFQALERSFDARVGETHHVVLPRLDALHIDFDLATGAESVVGAAARKARGIGARDQSLGRRASCIDAGAAEPIALDDGDCHARACQPPCERGSGLPGSDDDGVIARHLVLQLAVRRAKTISSARE